MRVRLATLGALLVLAATAVLASGCGATLDPVAQAATRTSDVSTLRFVMHMNMSVPGLAENLSLVADGAVDSKANRLELSMDLSRMAALAGQPGALGRVTIVEDGLVMYMNADAFLRVLPGGKSWVRLDLPHAASKMGLDLSSLTGGQSDPRTTLAQLRGAGNVIRVGQQTIKRVATTRYNVLLDLNKGLDRLEGSERDAMKQILGKLEAAGSRYVPADAWIDADGYLRRFRVAIPNYLGTGSSFALTMDLFDFGANLSIPIPSAAEVMDLTGAVPGVPGG